MEADEQPFAAGYRMWGLMHAAVITVLVGTAEFSQFRSYAFAGLAVWSGGAMALLFAFASRTHPDGPGPRLPNALTSVRTVAAVLVLVALAVATVVPAVGELAHGAAGWWIVGALLLVELTDFFDGRLARWAKAGRFGSLWDMENDALFAVALTLANRHTQGVGAFVLLIGLMRYLYVLLWHHERTPASAPRIQKLFSKTATAFLVTTLIVVLAPAIGPRFRTVSLVVALTMQIVSFAWDLYLQCRTPSAVR